MYGIDEYSIFGYYRNSNPASLFFGEMETLDGGSPFAFIKHSETSLLDIPLKGDIFSDSCGTEILLHDDIADESNVRLLMKARRSGIGVCGDYVGFALLMSSNFSYSGLAKVMLGEKKFFALMDEFKFSGVLYIPLAMTVEKK